jgi:hypothetical protein
MKVTGESVLTENRNYITTDKLNTLNGLGVTILPGLQWVIYVETYCDVLSSFLLSSR